MSKVIGKTFVKRIFWSYADSLYQLLYPFPSLNINLNSPTWIDKCENFVVFAAM